MSQETSNTKEFYNFLPNEHIKNLLKTLSDMSFQFNLLMEAINKIFYDMIKEYEKFDLDYIKSVIEISIENDIYVSLNDENKTLKNFKIDTKTFILNNLFEEEFKQKLKVPLNWETTRIQPHFSVGYHVIQTLMPAELCRYKDREIFDSLNAFSSPTELHLGRDSLEPFVEALVAAAKTLHNECMSKLKKEEIVATLKIKRDIFNIYEKFGPLIEGLIASIVPLSKIYNQIADITHKFMESFSHAKLSTLHNNIFDDTEYASIAKEFKNNTQALEKCFAGFYKKYWGKKTSYKKPLVDLYPDLTKNLRKTIEKISVYNQCYLNTFERNTLVQYVMPSLKELYSVSQTLTQMLSSTEKKDEYIAHYTFNTHIQDFVKLIDPIIASLQSLESEYTKESKVITEFLIQQNALSHQEIENVLAENTFISALQNSGDGEPRTLSGYIKTITSGIDPNSPHLPPKQEIKEVNKETTTLRQRAGSASESKKENQKDSTRPRSKSAIEKKSFHMPAFWGKKKEIKQTDLSPDKNLS